LCAIVDAARIADESAVHGLLNNKGCAGLKPCPLCVNVFNLALERTRAIIQTEGTAHHLELDTTKYVPADEANLLGPRGLITRLELAKRRGLWKLELPMRIAPT
jgi:hypothetical protein